MSLAGAFRAVKKDGTVYYRSSFTYQNKHISLGSFPTEEQAHSAYLTAQKILTDMLTVDTYADYRGCIAFDKYISILNFRDHHVYIKNPIYLQKNFFFYYLSPDTVYKFDIDDLFFYSSHKISTRGGHLFVADYGMQINVLSRYGIKSHAVLNRDYRFINGDCYDFRYENIEIINRFHGVQCFRQSGIVKYRTKILVNGLYTVGVYLSETEAAIAYNKAADFISKVFPERRYQQNFIPALSPSRYAQLYYSLSVSPKIKKLCQKK